MKSISASVAGKQFGLGLALVLSVTLATLLFNFLGTIACGALVGMMLGATGQWRWRVILVSLVFPAVIAAFLQVSKADLTLQQTVLLPIVCFGSFWLTYLLTGVMLCFEKRNARESEAAAAQAVLEGKSGPVLAADAGALSDGIAAPTSVLAGPLCEPGLDELQGTWMQAITTPDGRPCRKLIEVVRDKFALSVVGSDGQARVLCQGAVRLEKIGPFTILKVFDSEPDRSAVSAGQPGPARTWLYRVAGPTLTVAVNFEQSARDGGPLWKPIPDCRIKSAQLPSE